MSNEKGWICIYRKIQDCWIWECDVFSRGQAWIDLLLMANHTDTKIVFDNDLIEVKNGSFITSKRKLAERWKWSNTKVNYFLKLLEKDKMIITKSDSKKTFVTIINYEVYQSMHTTKNVTETSQKRHSDTTETYQKHTNNNDNNDNNENNIAISKDIVCSAELKQICEKWNELKELGIPDVSILTDKRRKMLVARIKQHGIEKIYQAMDEIKKSDYLQGKNKYNWIITFNWFVHPENFAKVLEGYYTKGSQSKGGYDLEFKRK